MASHVLLHLFLCCTTLRAAAALSFDYDFAAVGRDVAAANLVFMGNASYAGDRINLTRLGTWSTGRVAHRQLVRLWDDGAGGSVTSFTTAFSFAIGRNSTNQADGMAFYVGPPADTLAPDMTGGFLGLIPNTGEASPRTVGIEFDTCRNPWDPQDGVIDHIGVDVNQIVSQNFTALPTLTLAGVMRAEIRYDAAARKMVVNLTANGTNYGLEAAVDLRAAGLPQDAAVGFSAATGDLVESHQLLSWSFNSSTDIIASTSSLLGISILVLAVFLVYKKHMHLSPWQWRSTNSPRIESLLRTQIKSYTYSEVRKMTKSFAHTLGKGGYGTVYKGSLSDGSEIAVKMLEDTKDDAEDFINEVVSIGRTSHINVVTLLGLCLHRSKRALVYEYMPNGSLDKYAVGVVDTVQGEKSLSWEKLYEILVGIAQGLDYLHRWCNHRVVHLDIKPQNILLDQDFRPKISDFGLAKLCKPKESKISIGGARGTIGYMAPEVFWGHHGAVTTKSDVYSYGMLILQMVGARENTNASMQTVSKYFPEWLYDNLNQFCGAATEGIDSRNTCISEVARKLVTIGFWCIQSTPEDRPSMSEVIDMFDRSMHELQLPPRMSCCGIDNPSIV
uniref:non-specific serine/threonine protein kinase n=1 Tax=Oryza barthii TaxID=65489 RepID=A0A0D3GZ48_9ORYZ